MFELLKIKLNILRNLINNFKPTMFISVFLFNVVKGASEDKMPEPEFEIGVPNGIAEWEFFLVTAGTLGAVVGWVLGSIIFKL